MKHTLCNSTLAVLTLASIVPATAQTTVSDKDEASAGHIEFVKVSRDTTVAHILEKDRAVGPHEVPTPKFAIHTTDNKFVMTLGGYINPIMGYDFGNELYNVDGAGIGFVTSKIPLHPVKGKKSDFYINPFQGALTLQVVGFGGTENQVTGFIKVGTTGMNTNVALQRAYVTYRGFTAGQKLTLMQDVYACQPPTIDPQGPSGCISTVSYELSYTSKSYNGFRYALGLDIPSYYSSRGIYMGHDYPQYDGKMLVNPNAVNQNVPDIPMWVEYQQSPSMRVRASGLIRNFSYKDMLTGDIRHKVGWGVMLSGNVQPLEPWTLYLQAAYGKGIGNYIQDIAGLPLSFTPDDKAPGRMTATPMMGLNVGSSLNFAKNWQWNIMASEARVWNVGDYARNDGANNYRYGFYFATNVFYNINSYLQVGLEYLYGQHGSWGNGTGHDNRLQTQFMFTF